MTQISNKAQETQPTFKTNQSPVRKTASKSEQFMEQATIHREKALKTAQGLVQSLAKAGGGFAGGDKTDPTQVQRMMMDSIMMVNAAEEGMMRARHMEMAEQHTQAMTTFMAADLIGKQIESSCNILSHKGNQKHAIHFEVPENCQEVRVQVRNQEGDIVFETSETVTPEEKARYEWDGKIWMTNEEGEANLTMAPEGTYKINVEHINKNGNWQSLDVLTDQTVKGVAGKNGSITLHTENSNVNLSQTQEWIIRQQDIIRN